MLLDKIICFGLTHGTLFQGPFLFFRSNSVWLTSIRHLAELGIRDRRLEAMAGRVRAQRA